jgi:hypothetical protein
MWNDVLRLFRLALGIVPTVLVFAAWSGASLHQAQPPVASAADTPGADCGAKINAADAKMGSQPGTIRVTRACGLSWSTLVTLSADHNLDLAEPGTYVFEGILVKGRNQISGLGPSTILQLAPQQTYPPRGIAGIRLADQNDKLWTASAVSIRSVTLDGNYSSSPACRNGLQCAVGILIGSSDSSTSSGIEISNVMFSGWRGANVKFGNYRHPPAEIRILHNTFKDCVSQCIESTGFSRSVEITDNKFLGWGMQCTADCDAIFMYPNLPKTTDFDQHGLKIVGNTFTNAYRATKFATELFGGADYGQRFTDVNYTDNVHDDLHASGGGSGFSATILNGLVSRNVWRNGCGGQRCGIELTGTNVVVSQNQIDNGTITIGGIDEPDKPFTASNDVVDQNTISIAAQNAKAIIVGSGSDIKVTRNTISLGGSSGSCDGISVGIRGGRFGTATRVFIQGNQLEGHSSSVSPCTGIRIANSPDHPGAGIVVEQNTIARFARGIFDSQNDSSLKDISLNGNIFSQTPQSISLNVVGAVVKQQGNTVH